MAEPGQDLTSLQRCEKLWNKISKFSSRNASLLEKIAGYIIVVVVIFTSAVVASQTNFFAALCLEMAFLFAYGSFVGHAVRNPFSSAATFLREPQSDQFSSEDYSRVRSIMASSTPSWVETASTQQPILFVSAILLLLLLGAFGTSFIGFVKDVEIPGVPNGLAAALSKASSYDTIFRLAGLCVAPVVWLIYDHGRTQNRRRIENLQMLTVLEAHTTTPAPGLPQSPNTP